MYGLLKTIADLGSLVALVIAFVFFLIQPRVSKETSKRVIRRIAAWGFILSIVAHAGSALVFGPLQAEQEKLEMYRAPIQSATAHVTLLVECEESFVGTHLVGIRCGFGQGETPILATLTNQFIAMPRDEKQSVLMFSAELDKVVSALPSSVDALASSEYFVITIGNDKIPEGATLVEGDIVFTLNGLLHLEIAIPSQEIHDNKIFVRDLAEVFSSFPAGRSR